MLKIALINNMNNNFFSLARFLRDKGLDAHLFQVDFLDKHFSPIADTFDENVNHFVHRIDQISFRDFYKLPFLLKSKQRLKKLKNKLEEFDIVIACGGLAILEWAKIKVDIFVPYGGDLYQSPFMFDYCIKKHFPFSMLMKKYIKYQRRAITKTRAIIALASMDRHLYDALIKLNEKWLDWAIPMVYPLPPITTDKWDFLKKHDFIFFSHARQGWKTALDYKGNDRAIRAFARFLNQQSTYHNPIIVLFEYGPDVNASKELVSELGMENYVVWMPTMERKYIYEGLQKASLVFDFFHDEVMSFGGVTFEAFSCRAPVIGNTVLKNTQTKSTIPLVQAYTEGDILSVLLDYCQYPEKYKQQGEISRHWFDNEVGAQLVDKYIEVITYLAENKKLSLKDSNFNLASVNEYIGPNCIQ
jgi:glycosyltransferase involved in cell wall biosynthesis